MLTSDCRFSKTRIHPYTRTYVANAFMAHDDAPGTLDFAAAIEPHNIDIRRCDLESHCGLVIDQIKWVSISFVIQRVIDRNRIGGVIERIAAGMAIRINPVRVMCISRLKRLLRGTHQRGGD